MSDFLNAYSIQTWLESWPQGYLENTQFGHQPGVQEPDLILENPIVREEAIGATVQLVVGERAALAASSGLVNAAPDHPSKRFLATQTPSTRHATSRSLPSDSTTWVSRRTSSRTSSNVTRIRIS